MIGHWNIAQLANAFIAGDLVDQVCCPLPYACPAWACLVKRSRQLLQPVLDIELLKITRIQPQEGFVSSV